MKIFYIFLSIILLNFVFVPEISAAENLAGSSAALLKPIEERKPDFRVKILEEFLEQFNSPLTQYADVFVATADKYNLDWKLVAAISGVESTFGQQIPYNSYNGWGWGIYGTNVIRFTSWGEGIETVSEGLRTNYINKWGAQNVYQIGRFYAASPTWGSKVTYFMDKISKFSDQKIAKNLVITL